MPSPRLLRQSSDDVLATLISGLEVLQATSNILVNVPFLGAITGLVLGLAKTVQKVSGDRERYVRLARRATELLRHIEESIEPDPHAIDDMLRVQLIEIRGLLSMIQRDVERQAHRSALSRFLNQASISSCLDDHLDKLDSAWRAFDTSCLIALRMKMERQAVYDDRTQLRLFRWSDLRCLKVRGTYRVGCSEVGQEWEGKWDGRVVVVRTIKSQPHSSQLRVFILTPVKTDCSSLITYYPNLHHPYVGQVIGYSHPAVHERFYIVETGVVPLMHQFRGKDILNRLLLWLQHIIDYQDAFRYVKERGIPESDCHSHDQCLPSAMLNEEGRLTIDASDFCNSNAGCFQSRLRMLHDEEQKALSPGKDYAWDDDVSLHASILLTTLRSYIGGTNSTPPPVDVEPFINSDLAKIWASHEFQSDVDAQWGDYGYIQRNHDGSETFVRLGHIYDLVRPTGKIETFLLQRASGCDWQPAKDYPWPSVVVCHTFETGPADDLEHRVADIAVVRTIPDDSEYHEFFWNHSEDIAREHGLALHDIVLFEETFHYACATFDEESHSLDNVEGHTTTEGRVPAEDIVSNMACLEEIPSRLYFHQLPLLPSGEAASPWGCWSLVPESVPGPWPTFKIQGLELTCPVRSNYTRVSTFETEILVYLNSLRRKRHRHLNDTRFEEVS